MNRKAPIVIIEDDADDHELFEHALKELEIANPVAWFINTKAASEYLLNSPDQPFIIFCDMNLPGQNGISFKQEIDDNPELRRKSIPFVFYSTSASKNTVEKAYTEMTIQGFFEKPDDYKDIKTGLKIIFDYWKLCKHPNS